MHPKQSQKHITYESNKSCLFKLEEKVTRSIKESNFYQRYRV